MKTYVYVRQHLAEFFSELETFQTKMAGRIKTHIFCTTTSSRKLCRLRENLQKYGRAGQATDVNIRKAHALFMLHN
jgi:hypothetical protein